MNEEDKRKQVERAASYRQMMETWPWRDFAKFMEDERKSALERAISCEEMKDIQLQRGIVKALDSIQMHLGYILRNEQN